MKKKENKNGILFASKLTIRRASDNSLLTVDVINDEHWKKRLEEFCKGTDGHIQHMI